MSDDEKIVAIGLLTQRDLNHLGDRFHRAYPVEEFHDFNDVLSAIEKSESALR